MIPERMAFERSLFCFRKKLTVIGIIGQTQGVMRGDETADESGDENVPDAVVLPGRILLECLHLGLYVVPPRLVVGRTGERSFGLKRIHCGLERIRRRGNGLRRVFHLLLGRRMPFAVPESVLEA